MSLLVNYTLKSANDHARVVDAMSELVKGLKAEGAEAFVYSSFETDQPEKLVGLLEFQTDEGKAAFVGSKAFAAYRETVTPWLTEAPSTTELSAVASTRD